MNCLQFIISDGSIQELILFYLPASILLLINVALFILTANRIRRIQFEANQNLNDTIQQNDAKLQSILNKKKDM